MVTSSAFRDQKTHIPSTSTYPSRTFKTTSTSAMFVNMAPLTNNSVAIQKEAAVEMAGNLLNRKTVSKKMSI
jgi:hypothetical protein